MSSDNERLIANACAAWVKHEKATRLLDRERDSLGPGDDVTRLHALRQAANVAISEWSNAMCALERSGCLGSFTRGFSQSFTHPRVVVRIF
jgi:hypothetical protein